MRREGGVQTSHSQIYIFHQLERNPNTVVSWPKKNLQISEISLNLLVAQSAKMPPLMILHPLISLHKWSFVHVFIFDMMLIEAIVLFNR